MTDTRCVVCTRRMADTAYACTRCGITKPSEHLRAITDMTPAARDIAHGLSRADSGGASGKPGSRLPLDLGATSRLDAVQGTLTTWARHIAEERQGAIWVWMDEPIVEAAMTLLGHLEWMRHRPEADEFLADVAAAARVVAGIARGPAAQRYLGPCGAVLAATVEPCPERCSCQAGPRTGVSAACAGCFCLTACHPVLPTENEGQTCGGDIYARDGASTGRCRTCGAEVATDARRAWLDEQTADKAFRAAHIADAYGINVNTIRGWATERRADNGTLIRAAKLRSYYRAGEHVVPWTEPAEGEDVKARGPRLHYVGDVLALVKADAARRELRAAAKAEGAAA